MKLCELLVEFKTKVELDSTGRRVQKLDADRRASIDIRHARITVVPPSEEVEQYPILKQKLAYKPKDQLLVVDVVAPYALIQKAPPDEQMDAGNSWVREYGPKLSKDDAHSQIHLKDALKGRTKDDYIDPADIDQMARFGVEFLMSVSERDLPTKKSNVTVLGAYTNGRLRSAKAAYSAIKNLQVALQDPRTLLIPASSGHGLAKQFAAAVSEATGRKVYDILDKRYGEMTQYIYDKKQQKYNKHNADIAWHNETLKLRDSIAAAHNEAEQATDDKTFDAAWERYQQLLQKQQKRDKDPQSKKGQHTRHLAYKTQVANQDFHKTPEIAAHVDPTGERQGPPVVIIDDNFYGGNTISDVVLALYREGMVPESIHGLALHGLYDPK